MKNTRLSFLIACLFATSSQAAPDLTQRVIPSQKGIAFFPSIPAHVIGRHAAPVEKPSVVWLVLGDVETPMEAMDRVEESRRAEQEEEARVQAEAAAAAVPVNLANGRVLFASNRHQAKLSTLEEVLSAAQRQPGAQVAIVGHTDSIGSDDANQKLGLRRAEFVAAWLRERGVDAQLIKAESSGESAPVASNDHERGRKQNRRAEVTVWIRAGALSGEQ